MTWSLSLANTPCRIEDTSAFSAAFVNAVKHQEAQKGCKNFNLGWLFYFGFFVVDCNFFIYPIDFQPARLLLSISVNQNRPQSLTDKPCERNPAGYLKTESSDSMKRRKI
jgi:hypothetical protein